MWWWIGAAALIAVVAVILIIYGNIAVCVTRFCIENPRLNKKLDGLKIVHLADLQNCKYQKDYRRFTEKIRAEKPDFIVFSGDLIDRRKFNLENAREFISEIIKIAPVYFANGNHEAWCNRYDEVKEMLKKCGATVLDDECTVFEKNGGTLNIIGLKDPGFISYGYMNDEEKKQYIAVLQSLINPDDINILIAHRPELIKTYAECKADFVFCGHAHGGQFRLPFIGAFYAPHQGLFPKYTSGIHKYGELTEIISRGLGNGKLQFRIFNHPEIVSVTFYNK